METHGPCLTVRQPRQPRQPRRPDGLVSQLEVSCYSCIGQAHDLHVTLETFQDHIVVTSQGWWSEAWWNGGSKIDYTSMRDIGSWALFPLIQNCCWKIIFQSILACTRDFTEGILADFLGFLRSSREASMDRKWKPWALDIPNHKSFLYFYLKILCNTQPLNQVVSLANYPMLPVQAPLARDSPGSGPSATGSNHPASLLLRLLWARI